MSRETLATKRKQLHSMGKGQKPNASKPITQKNRDCLIAVSLVIMILKHSFVQYGIFFSLRIGMRGRDEHCKLRLGDMVLKQDENGEYVEWSVERGA